VTDENFSRSLEVSRIFTPTAPVDEKSLFAGRREQLKKVIDAVHQKGQHAVIYGERGVGKTSLSNVLAAFLPAAGTRPVITPRINCDSSDSFQSVFDKAFREINLIRTRDGIGFVSGREIERFTANDILGGDFSPDNIRRALGVIAGIFVPVIILDEFDRLQDEVKHSIADTIKSLSDHGVDATLVIVGVADTVVDLIREHASVESALVQIPMPRMSPEEISEIIVTGCRHLGLTANSASLHGINLLAQGLPHYAHLLGLYSARAAIEKGVDCIDVESVNIAIDEAVSNCQQSILNMYHIATMSPRKDNLFADVLLSCAMAATDQMGYFAAQDVRTPMRNITGKDYEIPSFSQHLNEFTEEKRGPILKKIGTPRRYRFRFINPLMQPYVIMQGCKDGKLKLA
jgi:energy-coupling factor transporter ATP-binding protein EcfA2